MSSVEIEAMTEKEPDALVEELAMQAVEYRDYRGDPTLADLLDRAALCIGEMLEERSKS